MFKPGIAAFPNYYVGINSLEDFATRADRVAVLNILGSESQKVTPVSHEFSGGNVVFGTSPGRSGAKLDTKLGPIPVYNNIAEGMEAGHQFNTAVIYLPPMGVRDGVMEVIRINPACQKIIIITEKVPVRDSRIIRAMAQWQGVDVFGANCLGVGDSHHRVRLGGALGGDRPAEALVPGSIAVFSNSGNFTTTIATYIQTVGFGTTVCMSSGKDVYIHFAAPEFVNALHNDARSKAAVLYVEPGGYYEANLKLEKPVIACIVGRWKSRLTRAVGHAGTLSGSGNDAAAKEKWFLDYFGVDEDFTPDRPVFSKKGALVTRINHIPAALAKVMEANGIQPDFEPKGTLCIRAWFASNQGAALPYPIDVATVEAIAPYNAEIAAVNHLVGFVFPRQTMKDTSGASRMDATTQVTHLHGVSVLEASRRSFGENALMSLLREYPGAESARLGNMALTACACLEGDAALDCVAAAREEGSSPNTALAAALALCGPRRAEAARQASEAIFNVFRERGIKDPFKEACDYSDLLKPDAEAGGAGFEAKLLGGADGADRRAKALFDAIQTLPDSGLFLEFLRDYSKARGAAPTFDALLAGISLTLAWPGLMRKRLSLLTVFNLPWHLKLMGMMVGAAARSGAHRDGAVEGVKIEELIGRWSFTEAAFLSLVGRRPTAGEAASFDVLMGLLLTNGPGTISAQGAKGAVSADGPEDPGRVQINKAYIGFLTHSGFAHGGNGFEGIQFLLERFGATALEDAGRADHGLDLAGMAHAYAKEYKEYKKKAKGAGSLEYAKIPCVNHPVFKGKDVNIDPREAFVRELFAQRGEYNVFLEFYHEVVDALFEQGVSSNVYCVNVDAVIAVTLLKILWKPWREGSIGVDGLSNAAFMVFLLSRMAGCAAEIDDHLNRGRNMDTRTPASQCLFVN